MLARLLPTSLAVLTLVAACSSAPGTGGTQPFDPDVLAHWADPDMGGSDTAAPGVAADVSETMDNTPVPATFFAPGRYARREILTINALAPVLNTQTVVSVSTYVLCEVTHEAGGVQVVSQVCDITQPQQMGVDTIYPDAFFAHLPAFTQQATGVGPAGGPWTLALSETVYVMGAKLTNPFKDSLPDEAADPRIEDSDEDGKPGITIKLTGLLNAELYFVQRNYKSLSGTLTADGKVAGLLHDHINQTQIGTNDALFEGPGPQPKVDPDPSKSTFVMLPVAAGTTCKDLLAQENTLFPAP